MRALLRLQRLPRSFLIGVPEEVFWQAFQRPQSRNGPRETSALCAAAHGSFPKRLGPETVVDRDSGKEKMEIRRIHATLRQARSCRPPVECVFGASTALRMPPMSLGLGRGGKNIFFIFFIFFPFSFFHLLSCKAFGAAGVSHDSPRTPNVPLEGPGASNTTKIPREDPRERERAKMGAGEGKKREILGPPPSSPHAAGPHPSGGGPPGLHFFAVWAPAFLIFIMLLICFFFVHF